MDIESQINELIIQMENRGYKFEYDGPEGIIFNDGYEKFFKDWNEVASFIDNNPID